MFKKVFLIIFLLFLLVGNHVLAPSKNLSVEIGVSILQPFDKMNTIAYAAEHGQSSKNANKVESLSWSSYIVPSTAIIVLLIGIGSYWLVFRKRQTQKEA
ncbi:hypothetical protein [Bacillus sp. EB600]|uniref:hypothetical protein n=1 Tax=Bacillus sp. EB600 TaxID=2806345 RepID=UPI00210B2325|nr:hypothetical protein [Bacillus sp. EB600]MCQ6282431.1 hypothetical protein [Bacillus sp. EB600]